MHDLETRPCPLAAQIEALVARHVKETEALEDSHLDSCIDEAAIQVQRHTLSPFLPTAAEDLASIFNILRLGPRHIMVDLGCGDGRPLIAAALLCKCRGVGVDISQQCIALAKSIVSQEGVSDRMVDFFRWDLLSDQEAVLNRLVEAVEAKAQEAAIECKDGVEAVVVFLYVYPTLLARMVDLLDRLVRAWRDFRRVEVVTLTYHLEAPVGGGEGGGVLHRVCGGRVEIHTLEEKT